MGRAIRDFVSNLNGVNAMRKTESAGRILHHSPRAAMRALRLAAVVLGIGMVMTAGIARAEDPEEEDDSTFEDTLIKGIMTGIGGTNMENRGIDYRERSPLVVPPRIDLPPPASSADINAPNWPKDPDVQRRKAAIAERKKSNKDPNEARRLLTPQELAAGKTAAASTSVDPAQPGTSYTNPVLSPSQLGYTGGLFKNMFGGSAAVETAPFTGEPSREALTQPPVGYQTPSPNYAYGTGPKESLNKEYNPAQGKY
jgi:hypothetical protein